MGERDESREENGLQGDRCVIEPCGDLCSVSSRPGMWGLVNDAGVFMFGDVELASMETYKEVADVNLWGTVWTTKAFLPLSEGPKVNWKGTFLPPPVLPYLFIFAQNGNRSQQIQHSQRG